MTSRREKGLCYHCDEVYVPGHTCKNKHIYIMITEEEETPQKEEQVPEITVVIQGELLQIEDNCGVSIHALTGTHGVHTIKLQGKVKNHYISMLLDSGSTHNCTQWGDCHL